MSKQELELPKGWAKSELGDSSISEILMGQSPPSSTYNKEKNGLPFFQGKKDFGEKFPTATIWCNKPNRIAEKGDILLSVRAPVGTINWASEECCIGRGLASIRPEINSEFIYYFLKSIEIELSGSGTGSVFNAISKNELYKIQISIPPLNEQKRIVSKIEELFSKIDSTKQSLEQTKLQLEQYRYSLLNYVLDNRNSGNKQNYNLFPISDVVDSISQGWSPKCERITSLNEKDWAVITTTAIQPMKFYDNENKKLPPNLEPRPQLELNENDLLITRAGPRSRVGITCLIKKARKRLLLCDKAYRIKFKQNLISGSFFEILLNSGEFLEKINEIKTGTSDSGLNLTMKRFSDLIIPLPSLAEQEQIVSQIEQGFSLIENTQNIVNSTLQTLQTMKMSVLKQAFEGKLVPQDPNDEHAEKLLERIKKEKS